MKIRYFIFPLIALLVLGCQGPNPEASTPTTVFIVKVSETSTKTHTKTPAPAEIQSPATTTTPTPGNSTDPQALWKGSPHASTYDPGKGPNTYCAKCHSPFNWDPKAQIGTAPNCVSCKLPVEKDPRISKQNPLVSMADWKNIDCKVCHETIGNNVSSAIAWWDQKTGKYESVADGTALCNKCHVDTQKMSHQVDLKDSAHSGFECLDCHNPHSTSASCSNSGCHENVRAANVQPISTPVSGHGDVGAADCGGPSCHVSATQAALSNSTIHGSVHAPVACIACHASGAQVGRSEANGAWGIFQTVEAGGNLLTYPASSHGITRQVDCKRCHFDGNPWKLPLVSGHEFGQ
jgi:hypothetical protein